MRGLAINASVPFSLFPETGGGKWWEGKGLFLRKLVTREPGLGAGTTHREG
jgi:hypothetical protein